MEPCSIIELTSTVLKVSFAVYELLKALCDAPAEVLEYLEALSQTRKVILDVQEYAEAHEQSTLMSVDGMQLDTLRAVLKDCEIVLTEQQSCLETFMTGYASPRFQRAKGRVAYVLSRDFLQSSTGKLMASQALLAQVIATSTGKNTVFIRDAVGSMASKVENVLSSLGEEEHGIRNAVGSMASKVEHVLSALGEDKHEICNAVGSLASNVKHVLSALGEEKLEIRNAVGSLASNGKHVLSALGELSAFREDKHEIRNAVGSLASNVEQVLSALGKEEHERQECLRMMSQYNRDLDKGIGVLMAYAENISIQNTTRLDRIENTLHSQSEGGAEQHGPEVSSCPEETSDTVPETPQRDIEPSGSQPQQANLGHDPQRHRADLGAGSEESNPQTENAHMKLRAMFQGNMDNLPAQQLRLLQKLCNGKAQGRRSHNIIDTWTSSLHYLGLGDDDRLGPYITLVLGAVSLIAKANALALKDMYTGIEELGDALTVCAREFELYRDNERIVGLVIKVYQEILDTMSLCTANMPEDRPQGMKITFSGGLGERYKQQVAAMRKALERLMREVDYQHRLEMRESSRKIADMHIQQQQMAQMLRDQRLLVESLQQERQIMKLVQEQQKILAAVQNIQQTMQSQAK